MCVCVRVYTACVHIKLTTERERHIHTQRQFKDETED